MTTTPKFAGLKRIASEAPEAVATALTAIEDTLREQLNNISVMKENLGIVAPVGEVKEGEPVEVEEVQGAERLAGLKRLANESPELLEEAIGEFYLAMDKVLAQTENLADNLDMDLPSGAPEEVDAPQDDPDAGLHGEMPTGGDDTPESEKDKGDDGGHSDDGE